MFKSRVSLVAAVATLALSTLGPSPLLAQGNGNSEPVIGAEGANCAGTFSVDFFECWLVTGLSNDNGDYDDADQFGVDGNMLNLKKFLEYHSSLSSPWTKIAKTPDAFIGFDTEDEPNDANEPNSAGVFDFGGQIDSPFALSFKWANSFLIYTFDQAPGDLFSYDVSASSGKDQVSHITLLGELCSENNPCEPPCDSPGGVPCEPIIVPEPTSLALMFGGLLGLGVAARRRRNS